MSSALTSRTLFFPEPAEAGYRCFVTEPRNDVLGGGRSVVLRPPSVFSPGQLLWAVLDWLFDWLFWLLWLPDCCPPPGCWPWPPPP